MYGKLRIQYSGNEPGTVHDTLPYHSGTQKPKYPTLATATAPGPESVSVDADAGGGPRGRCTRWTGLAVVETRELGERGWGLRCEGCIEGVRGGVWGLSVSGELSIGVL
jgi:hypothetical protein